MSHCPILVSETTGFPMGWCHNQLKPCHMLFNNKSSIIRLYFLVLSLVFLAKRKGKSINTSCSSLRSFHIRERWQKVEKRTSKNKYTATGKLEMKKPVAFCIFQHLELVVSQIGNSNGWRECKFPNMWKEQCSREAFFILSYLRTSWKMLLHRPFQSTRALIVLTRLLTETKNESDCRSGYFLQIFCGYFSLTKVFVL